MLIYFRKLLKMHETKYQPMDKVDAQAIMEEILGMQCGLNPNQQVGIIGIQYTRVQTTWLKEATPEPWQDDASGLDSSVINIMSTSWKNGK